MAATTNVIHPSTKQLPELRKTCKVGHLLIRYKLTPIAEGGYAPHIRLVDRLSKSNQDYVKPLYIDSVGIKWEGITPSGLNELNNPGDIQTTIAPKTTGTMCPAKVILIFISLACLLLCL